jgi:hypothetical protein
MFKFSESEKEKTYFGGLRIAGKKTPVDISSVSNIGVVALGSRGLENLLNKSLRLIRFFQKQLDHCGKNLKLCLPIMLAFHSWNLEIEYLPV